MPIDLHGWLILDKYLGITSAKILNEVKRILKVKKLGHSGTLDPLASGILVVALGEATKAIDMVMTSKKSYEFSITWGQNRDTADAEGVILDTCSKKPSLDELENILTTFTPSYLQTPPRFSAVKIKGKRAYEMARANIDFEIKPKEVEISKLEIISHNDSYTTFNVDCGKGFYIRSLALDIASKLNCLGYVSYLRRTKSAKFDISNAISLERLKELVYNPQGCDWNDVILPIIAVLDDILVRQVSESDSIKLKFGQKVSLPGSKESLKVVAVFNNVPIAICMLENETLIPTRVFNL